MHPIKCICCLLLNSRKSLGIRSFSVSHFEGPPCVHSFPLFLFREIHYSFTKVLTPYFIPARICACLWRRLLELNQNAKEGVYERVREGEKENDRKGEMYFPSHIISFGAWLNQLWQSLASKSWPWWSLSTYTARLAGILLLLWQEGRTRTYIQKVRNACHFPVMWTRIFSIFTNFALALNSRTICPLKY